MNLPFWIISFYLQLHVTYPQIPFVRLCTLLGQKMFYFILCVFSILGREPVTKNCMRVNVATRTKTLRQTFEGSQESEKGLYSILAIFYMLFSSGNIFSYKIAWTLIKFFEGGRTVFFLYVKKLKCTKLTHKTVPVVCGIPILGSFHGQSCP